jgi:glycosyltransferase involved in cell wall biosynthesis
MEQDKKILFDGRFLSLSHAGIGRYSCELLKHLLPLDEEQKYILLVREGGELDPELLRVMNERKNPVEVIETNIGHYSLSEQIKLPGLLRRLKPELVHFPHFNHPIVYNGDFVVTIHDLTLSQFAERGGNLKRKGYYFAISHAAKSAKKILAVSNFVRNELIREFKLPQDKVITTHEAIDSNFKKITNPRTLKGSDKYGLDKPYILSVGQWRSHKNLPALIEAFAELMKDAKWRNKTDLVFVGREDPKYPFLKQQVIKYGLQKNVKFTGFVPDADLPVVYNNATAFVFPSLSEGFGLPGLEAQACGVALASSNRTSLPEIYGKGALYFNPSNVNDIHGKILEILEDEVLRDNLIKLGLENAKKYSWDKTAQKTLEVYRELLYKVKS